MPEPYAGAIPESCPACLGESFWRPHHSDRWFCDACCPPAISALIAQHSKPPASDTTEPISEVSELIVMAGAPVCRNCGGAWYVETWEGVDGMGSTTNKCWTCHSPVTGEIQTDLIRTPRKRGRCHRSGQDR